MSRNELLPNLQRTARATQNETIIRGVMTSARRMTDLFLRLMDRERNVRHRRLSTPRAASMIQLLDARQTLSSARRHQSASASIETLEPRKLLSGTTIIVSNTNDSGMGSLRAAIDTANQDNDGDTIKFASMPSGAIIHLTSGELEIMGSMTITGPGASQLTIDGGWDGIAGDGSRILEIFDSNPSVVVTGLTLIHGDGNGEGGGAIYNAGNLTLDHDAISENVAVEGGSIDNQGTCTSTDDIISGDTTAGRGGGVINFDNWTSTNDTITGNSAGENGGGVYNQGTWTSTNDTISENSAGNDGGGVLNSGEWTSTNDTITGNSASSYGDGGGVYNAVAWTSTNDTISGNLAADGGGLYNYFGGATWNSTNDTIARNTATSNIGGGVDPGTFSSIINTIISGNSGGDLTGTISNTTTSNVIGRNVAQVLATDANGKPLLANNGGPTKTIALIAGSPAIGIAVPLTTLNQNLAAGATTMTVADGTFLAIGQQLKIDSEIVTVTAAIGTAITITRASGGGTTHASGAAIRLAYDQTGAPRTANDAGAVEKVISTPTSPTVTVIDAGGPYNGHAYSATATVKGVGGVTVSGTTTFTYYVGNSASGTGTSTAPTNVGTYTVVASFVSSNPSYTNASGHLTFTITPAAPPVVSGLNGTVTYLGKQSPISLAPNVVISQPAGFNIQSATVSFANWQAGDQLQFSNTFALQHTFTQNLLTHTALLTITGSKTAADYQATLRSLTFWAAAGNLNTSTRVATYTVTDVDSQHATATQNVAVKFAPPTVSGLASTVTYVKNAAPLSIAPNLVVTQPSGLNIASATVSFANWQAGDQLQFLNTFALQHTFTQNLAAHTALLTITGSKTAAAYQTTLRSLVFWAAAGNLNTSTRIATITVTDVNSKNASGTQDVAVTR